MKAPGSLQETNMRPPGGLQENTTSHRSAHLLSAVVLVGRWHIRACGHVPLGGVAAAASLATFSTALAAAPLAGLVAALTAATAALAAPRAAAAGAQAEVVVLHEALVAGAKAFLQVWQAATQQQQQQGRNLDGRGYIGLPLADAKLALEATL